MFYGDYYDVGGFAFIGYLLLLGLFALAVGLVFYLLQAVGLYKMGKTVGVSAPWLAFIPVVNVFALGKIAETPTEGKKPMKYGTILLLLNISSSLISNIMSFRIVNKIVEVISQFDETNIEDFILDIAVTASETSVLTSVLSVIYVIFYYIALYKVFKLFSPDNATVFLVLSILFGIALPIIIFCLRNKPIHIFGMGNGSTLGYNSEYGQQDTDRYGWK